MTPLRCTAALPPANRSTSRTATGAYLLHVVAEPLPYPQLRSLTKDLCRGWKPTVLLIEDHSSGQALIQDLRNDTDWPRTPIVPVRPTSDKPTRMSVVTPQMSDGQLWLPVAGSFPWQADFEKELTFFPRSAHKDQCDALSQFLSWRREHPLLGTGSGGTWTTAPTPGQQRLVQALQSTWGRGAGGGRAIRVGSSKRSGW